MKPQLTILFTSAGRRVELLNCFRESAGAIGVDLRVLAADAVPHLSAACRAADAAHAVPRCTEPAYIPRLREICAANRVDLLVPTIDTELRPLAAAREQFAAIGTWVAVSDEATVAMARDKLRTAEFLSRHGIPSPVSVPLGELLARPEALRFPVILKHIDGSSSVGLESADTIEEVCELGLDVARYMAQEKWRGDEYTVNMFFNRDGVCRAVVPHHRMEVRTGEVSKGRTVRHPLLADFARQLAVSLPGARGAICFQAILAPEGGVVFEINARFGGGYPLTHRAGAPFARWMLEEAAELRSTAADDWQENLTMLRYDAAVFIPGGTA